MEKVILGIDPGTNIMGYGVIKVKDNKAEMVTMGVIDLRKFGDGYLKLGHIYERVTGIIEGYLPDEMAIEAPFLNKNVQTTLKLGRAQGTAIAAAIQRGVPVHEYAPAGRCLLSLYADEPTGVASPLQGVERLYRQEQGES